MKYQRELLMIPGPIELDARVLSEMSSPMVAHYGIDWTQFYDETRNMLKEIMGTKSDLFLFVGSGHAALDAVIGSFVEEDDNILVLNNGLFGQRIAEICATYGSKITQFKTDWGQAFKANDLERYLEKSSKCFKAVMMVHTETSTGVTNPVQELNAVIKKYGLVSFVDAVCSVGVTELKIDEWGIDLCITASQKGLGAPPGLAIVCVNDKAWEVMENRSKKPTGWYLNLLTMREYHEEQREWQPYGITMAVNNVRALHTALNLIKEEGLDNRIKRHKEIANYFRHSIHEMGLNTVPAEEVASNAISVLKNPETYNSQQLIKLLKEDYNIRVANGLGGFANKIIRIGHMNLGASKNSVVPIINAFKEIIYQKNKR